MRPLRRLHALCLNFIRNQLAMCVKRNARREAGKKGCDEEHINKMTDLTMLRGERMTGTEELETSV